ncbi:MAG: ABC transporter ATP-binding protein/permease [Clostridium sp.]|jgi:putative ABC transport system permease protein|nr:ABC transporter ATP-binding protein/permease [Clostridium sp.]
MLQLKGISKTYDMGDTHVEALREVDLAFRANEFVSVLGPSGCGKTTLLNIVGGLDRYSKGDLVINGISTKEYRDGDWDIYRNNSIGFVFQSYNLISHQSVFANVELALTVAGISREERRRRVLDVLKKVGLEDQIHKKPNQMSGGQMQRVAIARALVNNPDILLADEPTGALDTETSVQIMELLKEIADDRLVIMVTHNPELAEKYSTRIIKLLDGRVIDDSNPYYEDGATKKREKRKSKKVSVSLATALSLSFKNLLTKKTRTILTSFAGSIGIIGIALILSLSSGMQAYVDKLEKDTLSNYPIELQSQSVDMASMMESMMENNRKEKDQHTLDKIYTNAIMTNMLKVFTTQTSKNDLKAFKKYLDDNSDTFAEYADTIQYGYDIDLQVYSSDVKNDGVLQINPSTVLEDITGNEFQGPMGDSASGMSAFGSIASAFGFSADQAMLGAEVWTELLDDTALLQSQYDVVAGEWPDAYDELVLVVNEQNELSDLTLYSLGLLDQSEIDKLKESMRTGKEFESKSADKTFTYEKLLALKFKLLLKTDYYVFENGNWTDKSEDEDYMKEKLKDAKELKVVGILRPAADASVSSIEGSVGYSSKLTRYAIDEAMKTDIAKQQLKNKEQNVFTGISFDVEEYTDNLTMKEVQEIIAGMPEATQKIMRGVAATMTEQETIKFFSDMIKAQNDVTYEDNLKSLGIADYDTPATIRLYPKGFDAKEQLKTMIDEYNQAQKDKDKEEYVISYSDVVAVMTASIANIINIISYVLIAFVAISLVVSSIMIAIITYISVLERTKEIGILRSIGASKKDISKVFNAETIIEGLVAGLIGVGVTLLLNIPISAIILSLADIPNIASLPIWGGVGLVIISVFLTVFAGYIPAKMAAKKDPVAALRTE